MKPGMYVRCPIVVEEGDAKYPRYFVLGQIVSIDDFKQTVNVKFHDLFGVRQVYDFVFRRKVFDSQRVSRCRAPVGSEVTYCGERTKLLSVAKGRGDDYHMYFIETRSGETMEVSEAALGIDFTDMDYDPMLQLSAYEFHNPSWFCNRLVVSSTMHVLNNSVFGFRTLAGCRAFLLPHQIVTIVRCLETRPVRYMLADEVGLGKTIEACSIVKILTEQNPQLRTLYVIPHSLVDQWKSELRFKFKIDADVMGEGNGAATHVIIPLDQLGLFARSARLTNFDILIVDETHRLLDVPADYAVIKGLSETAEHVLLLSATPIQDRKEELLKLLTLLSPAQYANMPLETFTNIVDKQSKIQKRVHTVLSDMEDYQDFSGAIQKRLMSIARDVSDELLQSMVAGIDLDSEDQGLRAAQQAVAYICEHYRLERRVIRNRRAMLRDRMPERQLRRVSYRMGTEEQMYNETGAVTELLRWLNRQAPDRWGNFEEEVAKPLLSAAFSSPWALEAQLEKLTILDAVLRRAVGDWRHAAETEAERMDVYLDDHPEWMQGRLLRAVDFIEQETAIADKHAGCKIVVFSAFVETLEQLANLLQRRFGKEIVTMFHKGLNRKQLQESVDTFQSEDDCRIMLCDETGGEGRNFQSAKMLLHLDLPWTVNALEQRIGRLDRLGRPVNEPVLSVVFHTKETIEEQLVSLLDNGMHVFTRSLSGLEIITGEINRRINQALKADIAAGLLDAKEDILTLMQDMRDAVEDEQLFDSAAMLYRPLTKTVEQMLEQYHGREDEVFAKAMLSWAGQAGLVPEMSRGKTLCTFSEDTFSLRAAVNALLLPPRWRDYTRILSGYRTREIVGTFNRSVAINREDVLFFAPGDTIFDTVTRNALNCGRGRCTALAARAELDFEGFVMTWNVEPNVQLLLEAGISLQLLSQFRAYLPMEQIFTVFPVRAKYQDVTAAQLQRVLLSLAGGDNKAQHLGQRRGFTRGKAPIQEFMAVYTPETWLRVLDKARKTCRERALEEVRQLADIRSARAEANRIVSAFRASRLYFTSSDEGADQLERTYGVLIESLRRPQLVLDAAAYVKLVNK